MAQKKQSDPVIDPRKDPNPQATYQAMHPPGYYSDRMRIPAERYQKRIRKRAVQKT